MEDNFQHKSNISTRISQIAEAEGMTITAFEKNIGASKGVFSRSLNNNSDIQSKWLQKIVENYPRFNSYWLLTGQGSMLVEKEETLLPKRKLIPFYDAEAEAGTLMVSNMDPVSEPVEWIDAGDWFQDADSAMRVHGDSMFPEYKSGSIVAMREVFNKRLVVYGEDYVIQTSEYKVIKRLMQSAEKGYWLACSVNNEVWEKGTLAGRLLYEPFEIFIDDVYKLFRVLGCVKRTESSRIVYNQRKKK